MRDRRAVNLDREAPRAFVSYAREDERAARRLSQSLMRRGVDAWLDRERLVGGQDWESEILRAIAECRYFIALLSSRSVTKLGYVQKELRTALRMYECVPPGRIFLIPVRLDECHPSFKELGRLQRIDLFPSWRKGIDEVLAAIDWSERLERSGPHSSRHQVAITPGRTLRDGQILLEQRSA